MVELAALNELASRRLKQAEHMLAVSEYAWRKANDAATEAQARCASFKIERWRERGEQIDRLLADAGQPARLARIQNAHDCAVYEVEQRELQVQQLRGTAAEAEVTLSEARRAFHDAKRRDAKLNKALELLQSAEDRIADANEEEGGG